jgi:hypothetical protein
MAIITRWRMPPESSCGNCFSRLAGSVIWTASSMRSATASALLACPGARGSLRSVAPDRHDRVQRGHRLLKHHGDIAAAHAAHGAVGQFHRSRSSEQDAARGDLQRRLRQKPHDGKRGHRLARAGFAGDAERFAASGRNPTSSRTRFDGLPACGHRRRACSTVRTDGETGEETVTRTRSSGSRRTPPSSACRRFR